MNPYHRYADVGCDTHVSQSDRLTATAVAGWFPDSVYGRPTPDQCIKLTDGLNIGFIWKKLAEKGVLGNEPLLPSRERLIEAVKLCRSLKQELDAAMRLSRDDILGRPQNKQLTF